MLGVLLALAAFVTFCDAECRNTPLDINAGEEITGCRNENGMFFAFDAKWTAGCQMCECNRRVGLMCCNMIMKPKGYDKVTCKEIFDKNNCKIIVVKKSKPSETCKVPAYVG